MIDGKPHYLGDGLFAEWDGSQDLEHDIQHGLGLGDQLTLADERFKNAKAVMRCVLGAPI